MTTLLVTHPACLEHDTGPGHPECIERLQVILKALEDPAFQYLHREEAPRASIEQLARVHDRNYIKWTLSAVPAEGYHALDGDTIISPGSGEAALRAAGALCYAVDELVAGTARRAFCAVRPPGHHAERDHAMGFCLFNNVAVGALHALEAHQLERVAIIDFDVHHGNGTQHTLARLSGAAYFSTHQAPLYPGTGSASDKGIGNIFNAPLAPYDGSEAFRKAYEERLLPALRDFDPDMIFISAGFDAHESDPLANLRLHEDDYAWVTEQLVAVAEAHCQGRVVSTLEGGYSLRALAQSAAAHVKALL